MELQIQKLVFGKGKHLETVLDLDVMLLRKFFNAHSKTAKESFYLECGIIPIRFIIAKRKLMYLRCINKRSKTDLVKKVFKIQKITKTPGDWAMSIDDDLMKYGMDLDDEQIEQSSKYKFENKVKTNVNIAAMKYLNGKAAGHSKSEDLMKTDVVREKYLDDPRFSVSDIQLLFKLRTKMLPVKTNFPTMWKKDVACRLCKSCVQVESQEHLLLCPELRKYVDVEDGVKYRDIFDHSDKQFKTVKIYRKLVRQQEILLNCDE